MVETSVLATAAPAHAASECPGAETCPFTAPRVRWYLHVWRLAEIVREPFNVVLRSEARLSRDVDPWARGGRVDPGWALNIGLSLELARDHHGIALNPHNAERISSVLCSGPHLEAPR